MAKKSNTFKYVGLLILLLGLSFILGLIKLGSYCIGSSTFLGCAGLSIPEGFLTGVIFALIGTVVYSRG